MVGLKEVSGIDITYLLTGSIEYNGTPAPTLQVIKSENEKIYVPSGSLLV